MIKMKVVFIISIVIPFVSYNGLLDIYLLPRFIVLSVVMFALLVMMLFGKQGSFVIKDKLFYLF